MIKEKVKDFINGTITKHIKDNGVKIECMVSEK